MTLRGRAEALLVEAARTGQVERGGAEELARDWLAAVGAHSALQLITGGAHDARRVVELCERILGAIEQIACDARRSAARGES